MGKFRKGILGGFSGTVGTVVGGNWNGIDYMRSRPTLNKKEATPLQKIQRAKFALASGFLNSLEPLLHIIIRDNIAGMTKHNSVLSRLLKDNIIGDYPNLSIDFKSLEISKGSLLNVAQPIAQGADAKVSFSWISNHGVGNARSADTALLLAHHAPSGRTIFNLGTATRNLAAGELSAPDLVGEQLHTWISFIAEDGKLISNSTYTGMVNVV